MKYKLNLFLFSLVTVFFVSSCEYKFNDVEVDPSKLPVDTSITYSFKDTVAPIFTDRACIACHKAGSIGANYVILTPDEAYNSIISKNLVDTITHLPSLSVIYTKSKPGSVHTSYTTKQANLIYQWISQGAKNN